MPEPSTIDRRLLAHSEQILLIALDPQHVLAVPGPNGVGVGLPRAAGEVGVMQTWRDLVKVRQYIGASFHSSASQCAPQSLGEASPPWDSVILEERASVLWGGFGHSVRFSETRAGCLHEPCPSLSRHAFLVELPGIRRLPRQESTALLLLISRIFSLWISAGCPPCWKCQEIRLGITCPDGSPGTHAQ